MERKREFSIFDDPYYNLAAVASATDYTGIAPSAINTPGQAAALAALYAARRPVEKPPLD
ncbi:MAG: hypothetical protein LBS11_12580 [Oscillospiraceae bacterium]|jgi:hypothetical protein|nr:hypothetical protein [Oscillospiraceae bacterium]